MTPPVAFDRRRYYDQSLFRPIQGEAWSCSMMGFGILSSLCLLAFSSPPAAQFKIILHNQTKAASSAEQFAQAAFLARDYKKAHGLLAEETRKKVSIDKLADAIQKMHPAGKFPADLKAIECEPQPGQRAMNIFLKGTAGEDAYYYRLYMVGDSTSGYEVAGLFRGNGPFPSKAKRPL